MSDELKALFKNGILFCGFFTLLSLPALIPVKKVKELKATVIFPKEQGKRKLASIVEPASRQCEVAYRWRYHCDKGLPNPDSCVKDKREAYLKCKSL